MGEIEARVKGDRGKYRQIRSATYLEESARPTTRRDNPKRRHPVWCSDAAIRV